MKSIICLSVLAFGFCVAAPHAQASILFQAFLNGAQEPSASTATGFGTVLLNDAQTQITVDMNWTGLGGGAATAAHIHTAPAGVNGPVTFPFSGVPAATSGSIPEQSFAITGAQVAQLIAGNMYMNIHNATFPGGEIRGQLAAVPEPATFALLGLGLAGLFAVRRKRV